ncbi:MAG: ABC1 kinase family protein [Leptolyngbyaceae cyanobacterium]
MSTVPNTTDQPSLSEDSDDISLGQLNGADTPHLAVTDSVGPASLGVASHEAKKNRVAPVEKRYRWTRRYSRPQRFVDIWSFFISFLGKRWLYSKPWSYSGGISADKQAIRRRAQARWIRHNFLNLGPTFIKLGQLFSTRSDLFPSEYVDELSKLQDQVPAFSYEQVKDTIETDLGRPLEELYKTFDPIPLAAASLGQVHRAQLYSGEEVVVKIQRPGLQRLFQIDLSILKGIAQYFQSHPEWGRGRDWIGIYEECCRILWLEIDFLHEGRNADTFRRNFRDIDWVKPLASTGVMLQGEF